MPINKYLNKPMTKVYVSDFSFKKVELIYYFKKYSESKSMAWSKDTNLLKANILGLDSKKGYSVFLAMGKK